MFVGVRRGPSLAPSDSQHTFDPKRSDGPLKTLTGNKNNKTDHSRYHHQMRNNILSQKSTTDH
eukprot:11074596-Heterocapsa_arctica.AAC.1